MTTTSKITQNLAKALRSAFDVDYPRPNAWVSVMDADFMEYPLVTVEDTNIDGTEQYVRFNLINSEQTNLTARRRYGMFGPESARMLIDVFVDQRKVQAFHNDDVGGWEEQIVSETVDIEFGDWVAEIELDDIYEDVEFPAEVLV